MNVVLLFLESREREGALGMSWNVGSTWRSALKQVYVNAMDDTQKTALHHAARHAQVGSKDDLFGCVFVWCLL